jgi:hypothetical protein
MNVRLYNGLTYINAVSAASWGYSSTAVGVWQLVVIPLSAFGNSAITTVTEIRFLPQGTVGAATPFAFDDIKFQSGYGPQTNTATIDILDNGTVIGSTSKLNFIDGPGTDLTIANDTLNNKIDVTIAANGQFQIYNNGTDTGLILDQTNQNTLIVQDVSTTGDIGLPLNSFQPIAIGSVFKVTNIGSATVFITTAPGVILNSRGSLNGIDSPHGVVTLTKTATNVWLLEGDLV